MRLIKNKQHNNSFSFSALGGKTKQVASVSSGFFVYPRLIAFLLLITLALLLIRVYFSNQLAVSGEFVSVNSSRVGSLAKENYDLENKLSQISALSYIEGQTGRLGLVKMTNVEVLKGTSGVALNQ